MYMKTMKKGQKKPSCKRRIDGNRKIETKEKLPSKTGRKRIIYDLDSATKDETGKNLTKTGRRKITFDTNDVDKDFRSKKYKPLKRKRRYSYYEEMKEVQEAAMEEDAIEIGTNIKIDDNEITTAKYRKNHHY